MRGTSRLNKALSLVLSGGAVGASIALSLAAEPTASRPVTEPPATGQGVATRLQAIRQGVSQVLKERNDGSALADEAPEAGPTPTWWGNGGWGRWHYGWGNGGFGWPNWHNWNNWPNGWHNWNNGGWNNWGNGWHNYWQNA